MSSLLTHLARYRPFRAMVVGDFMLDQHIHGAAERLSPDAPVPVLHATRFENSAGGAGNVARFLCALKGEVLCVGVTGGDAESVTLRKALTDTGCDVSGLLADPARPTTIKRSLIGLAQHRHPQKMFRVDIESRDPLASDIESRLFDFVRQRLNSVDVICLEDYNKGVCTLELCQSLITLARQRGKPVLVDPAAIDDYAKYRGATVITPNRSEAELATHLDTPLEATDAHNELMARLLLDSLALDAVVLTLDRHGAMLALPGRPPLAIPTVARNVYDVTGAGDMVLAALAGGLANGFDWPDAVRFANAAAGLEVEVFGVQPIPIERIRHSVLELSGKLRGKLRTLDELLVEVALRRERGQKIVFTNGCFDVLHAGHVAVLEGARREGDFLIVGLNDDASVRRLKGASRPVNGAADRARVLGALDGVGAVVIFAEDTPGRLLEAIRPDVLVKGGDYTRGEVVGGDFVESYGGRVVVIPPVRGVSTTQTLRAMAQPQHAAN